jgi:hypothetical protein
MLDEKEKSMKIKNFILLKKIIYNLIPSNLIPDISNLDFIEIIMIIKKQKLKIKKDWMNLNKYKKLKSKTLCKYILKIFL